jgi:hypothetical protein
VTAEASVRRRRGDAVRRPARAVRGRTQTTASTHTLRRLDHVVRGVDLVARAATISIIAEPPQGIAFGSSRVVREPR